MPRTTPLQRTLSFWPSISRFSRLRGIDPNLLAAVVAQESGGDPWAIRPEPRFLRRYRAGIVATLERLYPTTRPHWTNTPILLATSYGLCQILAIVALEIRGRLPYPTVLCDPDINLDLAALILDRNINSAAGDLEKALLRYNGGGNPAYPAQVFNWIRRFKKVTDV